MSKQLKNYLYLGITYLLITYWF